MRRLAFIIICFFASLMTFAGEVTEQEALQKAQQFLQGRSFKQRNLRRAFAFQDKPFYVFNADDKHGFVVVSADDRTIPILGYAEHGFLEADKLPANAKAWLEGYANQIKALGNATMAAPSHRALGPAVPPLVTAHWGQREPYNNLCPEYSEESNCLTGCVATAMAQVMYYHKWPQGETAPIPGYGLSSTTFKWNLMKDEYDEEETGDAADAVAELMLYCGGAVDMEYGGWFSGANVYASHLIKYFGYSTAAKDVVRRDYTTDEWDGLIYNEIRNARPVLYSGYSSSVGHEFVIDGYDDKGLFHVNWGWDGDSDGYFALSILNPTEKGDGGGTSDDGFTICQEAIIGLQPPYEGEESVIPIVYYDSESCNNTTRTSTEENFTLNLSGRIYNWEKEEQTIDFAWALYQGKTQVALLEVKENVTIVGRGYYTSIYSQATFGAGIADGTYQLRMLYRQPGTAEWQFCSNYDNVLCIISIHDNELITKQASDADVMKNAVQVNSCKIEGIMKSYQTLTATLNWTNNGYLNETPFYVYGKKEFYTCGSGPISSYVDPGETGDVVIDFNLQDLSGEVTIELATGPDGNTVVWSQVVNIEETLEQDLDADINIAGMKGTYIESTTIDATVTMRNCGENNYDDEVLLVLRRYISEEDWSQDGPDVIVRQPLSLAPGEVKALQVKFPDLIAGRLYQLMVKYYSNEENPVLANYVNCKVGVKLPKSLDIDADVTNTKDGKTIAGSVIVTDWRIRNTGQSDYNNKIVVKIYEESGDEQVFLKQQDFSLQLAQYQTKDIENYEITGLSVGKTYSFSASYYNENEEEVIAWTSPSYYVIILGDVNSDNLVNVTDIVATVNYIMEKPSEGFNKAAADLNGDGEINVTDIVKMVSIIMTGEAARRAVIDE